MVLAVAVSLVCRGHDAAHFAARRHVSDVLIATEIRGNVLAWHCWRQSRCEARGDADVEGYGGDDCDLGHGLGPPVALSTCAHLMVRGCRNRRAPDIERGHSSVRRKA